MYYEEQSLTIQVAKEQGKTVWAFNNRETEVFKQLIQGNTQVTSRSRLTRHKQPVEAGRKAQVTSRSCRKAHMNSRSVAPTPPQE